MNIGEIAIEKVDGFDVIASESKGNTQNIGKPELPTYTFNYSIDYNKDYTINLEVGDYVYFEWHSATRKIKVDEEFYVFLTEQEVILREARNG